VSSSIAKEKKKEHKKVQFPPLTLAKNISKQALHNPP
jgi:hypothetical protein